MSGRIEVAGDRLRIVGHIQDENKMRELRIIASSQSNSDHETKSDQGSARREGRLKLAFTDEITRRAAQPEPDQISEFFLAKMPAKPDGSVPPVSAAISYGSLVRRNGSVTTISTGKPAGARYVATAKSRCSLSIRNDRSRATFSPMVRSPVHGCAPQARGASALLSTPSRDVLPRSRISSYPPWHSPGGTGRDSRGIHV
jgi:hypothetical protein